VDWHTKSFHFETSKHEAPKCEAFIVNMSGGVHNCACHAPKKKRENGCMHDLQQKKDINGM
jgi:hypothetical protein